MTSPRLKPNADIAHSPVFEAAFVYVQTGTNSMLTRTESVALYQLKVGHAAQSSFASQLDVVN